MATELLWIDIAILVIIALSMVLSFFRGYVQEILSLVSWIIAVWIAFHFAPTFAPYLAHFTKSNTVQHVGAGFFLGLLGLMAGAVISFLAGRLIHVSGLSGIDRLLGIVFGLVRGVFLIGVLVLLAGLTPLPRDPWWAESIFLKHFVVLAEWMRSYLPENIASNIIF